MRKVIEETDLYTIFEKEVNCHVLTLRRWKKGEMGDDILFDDSFAGFCGYCSVNELLASTIGEQNIVERLGCVPKWVRVFVDGRVCFVNYN